MVTVKTSTKNKTPEEGQMSSRRHFLGDMHKSAAHLPPEEALCKSRCSNNATCETAGCRSPQGDMPF